MKKPLVNLQDAMAYLLNQLYDAESKTREMIGECRIHISSQALRNEIEKYAERANDKITKIERAFNYLMEEPAPHGHEAMDIMMEDVFQIITHTSDPLRDTMIISCFQNISHHKIAGYGTVRAMALELEMEVVGDLMSEILAWEKEADHALTRIALSEANLKAALPKDLINT